MDYDKMLDFRSGESLGYGNNEESLCFRAHNEFIIVTYCNDDVRVIFNSKWLFNELCMNYVSLC